MSKVLFVTGCPRSGTSFYSMYLFDKIDGFYIDRKNYEPPPLHDAQLKFLTREINDNALKNIFIDFVKSQNVQAEKWIVIKQPFFSFILNSLLEMPFEKKILVTKRDPQEILSSRMNYKDSISQVVGVFQTTWLYCYGLHHLENEWNSGSHEKRMSIYIREQQKIENLYADKCLSVAYGENLATNHNFHKELGLNEIQIEQLNQNFIKLWKNEDYEILKQRNIEKAKEYKSKLNI